VERRTADIERNTFAPLSPGSLLACAANRPEHLAREGNGQLTRDEGRRTNLGKALVQIRL